MSDLPSILSDLNPENKPIIGQKAVNLTRNILSNIDLSQHTAQEVLSALRDNNINIPIPSFYQAYSDIQGRTVRSQRIRYVNQRFTPSESVFEPALYPLQTRYRLVYNINYEDLDTGIEINRDFVMDTNTLNTIAEMQAEAIEAFESRYNVAVVDITTRGGYIYKGNA